MKCGNPCLGACGIAARCQVLNHNPICSCPPAFTGDPFIHCTPRRKFRREIFCDSRLLEPATRVNNLYSPFEAENVPKPVNPCQPSPCGPNAQCQVINDSPSCSCAPEYIGTPPNCRPECISNSECPSQQACINRKCRDPCPGSCFALADCHVVNHVPTCSCRAGYTGDPFVQCTIKQESKCCCSYICLANFPNRTGRRRPSLLVRSISRLFLVVCDPR